MSFLTYILEHLYQWGLKFLELAILDAIFRFIVLPYTGLLDAKIYFTYYMTFLYRFFPENVFILVENMFFIFLSIRILAWIMGRPSEEHIGPSSSINPSTGFTSRRV